MGADGFITIWRDDKVREQFPNCDDLFGCLPTHYLRELDGTKYHHCYMGDNLFAYWNNVADAYLPKDGFPTKERLQQFIDWLEKNGTKWEVWT